MRRRLDEIAAPGQLCLGALTLPFGIYVEPKMRFTLPIACILTFCIVFIGNSDAMIPFGYLLVEFLTSQDEPVPLIVRVLLLVPFAATLLPSFVTPTVARSVLTIVGVFLLTVLWLFGIVVFVIYPMPGNQIPNWVPAITSIPFLLTVIGTMTYCVRTMRLARRKIAV